MEPLGAGDLRHVGPYRLLRRLGRGGMGQVFLGRSPGGRLVAVKVVAPELASDAEFRRRFALEVAAARKVGGFYTAQVVDADPEADPPWLVTAYIAGPSLQQAVRTHGPLPYKALRVLGSGLAEGLAAIHTAGLVHRDLKPGNVILADDGPRVIDFGIARALDAAHLSTSVIGTPGFMSPEQARGQQTGPESDVFALACVLVYAATGHAPYGEGRPEVVLYRTVYEEPDLTGVPDGLVTFLTECLAGEPARRPRVPDALRHLATSAEDTEWLPAGVSAMISERRTATLVLLGGSGAVPGNGEDSASDAVPTRPHRSVRRRRAALAALGLAVGTAATWGTVTLLNTPDPPAGKGGDRAGATPSVSPIAASGNPCDIIDNDLIADHQLVDTGTRGGYQSGSTSVRTCKWQSAEYGADTDFSYTLAYAPAPIQLISDRETPEKAVDLSGIPSATAHADAASDSCEVSWPTSFGYAAVLARIPPRHLTGTSANCMAATQFARSVLPKLSGRGKS
ncbi:protein kinase [Streptomyces sp. NPDC097640]|uniref:serine/threonine-protein kinase n=1 Tax=Streptomyces sp. NPDC097640 TaxID=3157229 RepID=UPI003329B4CE